MVAKHPTKVGHDAGTAAGIAFAAAFTQQLPQQRRNRSPAAHRARIRRLQRDLAIATARRG